MILGNPLLDDFKQFFGLRHNLQRLSLGGDKGVMVINHVSFSPTSVEVIAVELAQKAAGFRRSLPESLSASLADLVRAMNCYYSNLIEGHDTHPVDIERALKDDYSKDPRKRDLQLEAKAHITVQKWIDGGGLKRRAVTIGGIREIHRRFGELLPEDLLWVEDLEAKNGCGFCPAIYASAM